MRDLRYFSSADPEPFRNYCFQNFSENVTFFASIYKMKWRYINVFLKKAWRHSWSLILLQYSFKASHFQVCLEVLGLIRNQSFFFFFNIRDHFYLGRIDHKFGSRVLSVIHGWVLSILHSSSRQNWVFQRNSKPFSNRVFIQKSSNYSEALQKVEILV